MGNNLSAVVSTIMASASNVLVQIFAARFLDVEQYSKFALAAATLIFCVGLSRNMIGQNDLIRGARGFDSGVVNLSFLMAGAVVGAGVLTVFVGSALLSATIMIIGGALITSAVFVLQDAGRFRAFRTTRAQWAVTSDFIVLLIIVLLILGFGARISQASAMVSIWGLATLLGFFVLAIPLGFKPGSFSHGIAWWRTNSDITIPGVLEYLLLSTVPYILYWVILWLGGAIALAGYRITQLVFGVLGNLAQGFVAFEIPAVSDNPSRKNIWLLLMRNAAILVVIAVGLYFFLLNLSDTIGVALFGPSWSGVAPFLIVGVVHGISIALGVPNFQILRILGEARYSLHVRTFTVLLTPILSLGLGVKHGAIGIAWALALVNILSLALRTYRIYRRTLPQQ